MTDHFQDLSFSFWNLISLLWWAHHFQDYISYYFLFFLYSYYILELDLFAVVGPIFFVEERFIHQTSGHQVNLQWFLILTLCPMMLNVGGIAIMINTVNLIISSSSYPLFKPPNPHFPLQTFVRQTQRNPFQCFSHRVG